jgi:hypothetical protein
MSVLQVPKSIPISRESESKMLRLAMAILPVGKRASARYIFSDNF